MESNPPTQKFFVFEFFSGIGGMHQALKNISTPYSKIEIVHIFPFDINPNANSTYFHVFGVKPNEISIENFSLQEYTSLCKKYVNVFTNIIWVMSPPCQPFTRLGNQKDLMDPRSKAFIHILKLLKEIDVSFLPEYLLLENVKNFENSDACTELIKILKEKGYIFKQFLLSPVQVGVPNSRLRYYLIAKLQNNDGGKDEENIIQTTDIFIQNNLIGVDEINAPTLNTFLNYIPKDEINKQDLLVPKSILSKESSLVVDLVTLDSISTNCFTKGYGRFLKGTGSLLLLEKSFLENPFNLNELEGSVRFFSPEEICKLMSFNDNFDFPNISLKSKYKLLGNSVNVKVISLLLKYLLFHFGQ